MSVRDSLDAMRMSFGFVSAPEVVDSINFSTHTMRGSIPWMAPEVMQGQHNTKADIWSLGC